MEQISAALPGDQAGQAPLPSGELIIQNGRLSGTRRPLSWPITTVGRAESCDVRLDRNSVHFYHCVLAFGPAGLTLRNLAADKTTRVNGEPRTLCTLQDGDLLTIGPF